MSDESHYEFACPECGNVLAFPIGGAEKSLECPHCYALVTSPMNRPDLAIDETSTIIENSPLEYPLMEDRKDRITDIVVLWVISIIMRFVFPFPALFVGLLWTQFAFFSSSPMQEANPLRLLFSIPLIVASIHSFRAGRSLARLRPGAIRKVNCFLAAGALYSLIFWTGFALHFENEYGIAKSLGIAMFGWLVLSVPPLVCLAFYFHFSSRVRTMYENQQNP